MTVYTENLRLQDLKVLAGTKTLLNSMQRTACEVIGKWAKKDNLVTHEVGEVLIEHAVRVTPESPRLESVLTIDKPTFPERRVINLVSILIRTELTRNSNH